MQHRWLAGAVVFVLLIIGAIVPSEAASQRSGIALENQAFAVRVAGAGIVSLRRPGDTYDTEYVNPAHPWGDLVLHYRLEGESRWSEVVTNRQAAREVRPIGETAAPTGVELVYEVQRRLDDEPVVRLTVHFALDGNALRWTTTVENLSERQLEIGDLGFALDHRSVGTEDVRAIYENNAAKHHSVAGHGSWLYWQRPNGVPPYLVLTPQVGTWLEYLDVTDQSRTVGEWPWFYVHSAIAGAYETRGTWRQQHTRTSLAPAGRPGASLRHGFDLAWADSYAGVRDRVVEAGLVDVTVAPGMTIPTDLTAHVALRSRNPLRVEAEFPATTDVEYVGETTPGTHVYRVRFSRLGENALVVRWPDTTAGSTAISVAESPPPEGARAVQDANAFRAMVPDPTGARWATVNQPPPGRVVTGATEGPYTLLEFFVTEPLETLIKKRAAHIAGSQQHRDPDVWYDGLFSVWDMRGGGTLRGPDNTGGFDGWRGYTLAADDPGLSKAPYVAAKNAIHADAGEIEALEYYIERYVWGGLQRTDTETPYPYGIYGVPNWFANRNSPFGFETAGKGLDHIYRMYDYPHIVMLYLHMYQIARDYPELTRVEAATYLERAYRTAVAYFEIPYEVLPWYEIYKWGTMNEIVVLDLVLELERRGRVADAALLRGHIDRKIKYFVYDDPYAFRSEYAFDSTGFESSYALARFALLHHELEPTDPTWYDKNFDRWYSHPEVSPGDVREFLERQQDANIALRGWLEPAYYAMGSDYRQGRQERYGLSYMSQMGGWSILDYALRFAGEGEHADWMRQHGRRADFGRQAELLRLGYASILSSWALMNTSADGDGGFWYGGRANDGAAGWGFGSRKFSHQWILHENGRGPWFYDGEIDLGFGAALRAAATVVVDDPIFGLIAYGGQVREFEDGSLEVIPRDGVRRRLWVLRSDAEPISVELDRGKFAQDQPIRIGADGKVSYELER